MFEDVNRCSASMTTVQPHSDSLNNNTALLMQSHVHSGKSSSFDGGDDLLHFSDDDDTHSHTSSLESASTDDEHPNLPLDGSGRKERKDDLCTEEDLGSSASCSVDSFELRSPFDTIREEDVDVTPQQNVVSLAEELRTIPQTQINQKGESSPPLSPADSGVTDGASGSSSSTTDSKMARTRLNIKNELAELDTAMPHLDFDKLEEQLNNAAMEREMRQRKLMSEEVRRKLAREGDATEWHPPAPTHRPCRSNLATRLQSGMNLQVCYMNDAAASDDDARASSGSDTDDDFMSSMPKSKSMPISLCSRVERALYSNGQLTASDLRKKAQQSQAHELNSCEKRSLRLAEEAQVMMAKAKQAAHMQMEVEKQERHREHANILQSIHGLTLDKMRLTRLQLRKFNPSQLTRIVEQLHNRIQTLNEELVHFLIDRDSLHMEQDSMLVDVEDLLQHQRASELQLPDFLIAAPVDAKKPNATFRIFKR